MMAKGSHPFKTLSKALISKQRSVLISEHLANGSYTIGQQVEVLEGSKLVQMFIKGAIHVETAEGLYNLRDALNEAIKLVEDDKEAEQAKIMAKMPKNLIK